MKIYSDMWVGITASLLHNTLSQKIYHNRIPGLEQNFMTATDETLWGGVKNTRNDHAYIYGWEDLSHRGQGMTEFSHLSLYSELTKY